MIRVRISSSRRTYPWLLICPPQILINLANFEIDSKRTHLVREFWCTYKIVMWSQAKSMRGWINSLECWVACCFFIVDHPKFPKEFGGQDNKLKCSNHAIVQKCNTNSFGGEFEWVRLTKEMKKLWSLCTDYIFQWSAYYANNGFNNNRESCLAPIADLAKAFIDSILLT